MNQTSIYVFAKWRVKEGQLKIVLSLLEKVAQESNKEEGNLLYKIHQSNSDANTLLLYEGYKNEAAVATHRASDHFQSIVIEQIVPLLEDREVTLATGLFE